MKILVFLMSVPILSIAQEAKQETHLLGSVSDGKPTPQIGEPEAIEFDVVSSQTIHLPDRKLTIRKVLPPVIEVRDNPEPLPSLLQETYLESKPTETELLFVSATVYQNSLSHVNWWTEGKEHSAWTDINFHNFSGFTGFVHKNRSYSLILGIGDEQAIPPFEWKPEVPGSFLVSPASAQDPKAIEFAEAFTSLYAREKDTLIAARLAREAAARKAALEPPVPPADIILNIWDKPSRPLTPAEITHRDAAREGGR